MKRLGTALLTALVALLAAPAAYGQQEHLVDPGTHGGDSYWTRRGGPPDGSTLTVTYHVPTAGFGAFSLAQEAAINRAATTWNSSGALVNLVAGGPGSDITFVFSPVIINLPPGPGNFGDPAPLANSSQFLFFDPAHAGVHPDGTDMHTIFPGTLVFLDNGLISGVTWYDGTGPVPGGFLDMESYALHEFGHSLGLGVGPGAMDNIGLGPGVSDRSLSSADIAALQLLYGTPEPTTFVLFGMGLLAVGASRKFRKGPDRT